MKNLVFVLALVFYFTSVYGDGFKWRKISDSTEMALQKLDKSQNRDLYIVKLSDKNIYVYNKNKSLEKIGGPGKNFVIAAGNLYGLSPDSSAVYAYDRNIKKWSRIGGPAKEIYGFTYRLYATNEKNEAYIYDSHSKKWSFVCDDVKMLAKNRNSLYKICVNGDVRVYNGKQWVRFGANAKKIYAGGAGKVYIISRLDETLREYKHGKWRNLSSEAKMFAVCHTTGSLYRLDDIGVWHYNESESLWKKIGGPAGKIFVGEVTGNNNSPNKLYATNPQSQDLWCYSDQP